MDFSKLLKNADDYTKHLVVINLFKSAARSKDLAAVEYLLPNLLESDDIHDAIVELFEHIDAKHLMSQIPDVYLSIVATKPHADITPYLKSKITTSDLLPRMTQFVKDANIAAMKELKSSPEYEKIVKRSRSENIEEKRYYSEQSKALKKSLSDYQNPDRVLREGYLGDGDTFNCLRKMHKKAFQNFLEAAPTSLFVDFLSGLEDAQIIKLKQILINNFYNINTQYYTFKEELLKMNNADNFLHLMESGSNFLKDTKKLISKDSEVSIIVEKFQLNKKIKETSKSTQFKL